MYSVKGVFAPGGTIMTRYIAAWLLLGLTAALPFAARAADDPPADTAATVSADAKVVGAAVKHSAKAVAKSAKEGAQKAADAAKGVAHDVSTAAKHTAREVAAAAKRGAKKTKAAVTPASTAHNHAGYSDKTAV
jgi:hypothetical protein